MLQVNKCTQRRLQCCFLGSVYLPVRPALQQGACTGCPTPPAVWSYSGEGGLQGRRAHIQQSDCLPTCPKLDYSRIICWPVNYDYYLSICQDCLSVSHYQLIHCYLYHQYKLLGTYSNQELHMGPI